MFKLTVISLALLITTAINFVVSYISWRRRDTKGGMYFSLGMMCVTLWSLATAFDYAAVPISLKIFFATIEAWGYCSAIALFTMFAILFAGYDNWLEKKWIKTLLFFIPSSNILLISTNTFHGWVWKGFKQTSNNVLIFEHAPGFLWILSTSYLLILTMIITLWLASRKGSEISRRQGRLLLYAILFPFAANLVYNFGIGGMAGVDWTSITFSVTGGLCLWALYGQRLLDIVPIARDKLVSSLGDGMIVIDRQNRIIDINHVAEHILESQLETLIGKDLVEIAPQSRSFLEQPLEQEIKTELEINTEVKRYFDVLLSPLYEGSEKIIGRLIIFRDITKRKENELRLLQLTEAVEQSPASVMITDPKGNITYVNPQFTIISGYSRDEIYGKNPRITQSQQTPAEVYREMWQTILSGQVWRGELLNRKKNGDLYWELDVIAPVFDHAGRIINFIAAKEDVTQRKLAEDKLEQRFLEIQELHKNLQQTQEQLVKQQRTLAKFEERQRLGRDLHDSVNQSIHGLMLYSETLIALLEKKNVKEAIDVSKRLQSSGRQALKEVRLLIYDTQTKLINQNADLLSALEERLNMVERRVGIKGQLIVEKNSINHFPDAWNENLYWMIIEALNNALKHAQARNVKISISATKNQLELEIVDDGIGFDLNNVQSGGFGMKTMHERAELLKGQMRIDSSPGSGTHIYFKAETDVNHEENKNPDRG